VWWTLEGQEENVVLAGRCGCLALPSPLNHFTGIGRDAEAPVRQLDSSRFEINCFTLSFIGKHTRIHYAFDAARVSCLLAQMQSATLAVAAALLPPSALRPMLRPFAHLTHLRLPYPPMPQHFAMSDSIDPFASKVTTAAASDSPTSRARPSSAVV
jgi:hypothetical protein